MRWYAHSAPGDQQGVARAWRCHERAPALTQDGLGRRSTADMPSQPIYGPHNPHPLSQMRTELVWEGKYDEYGNRREVDVAGLAMPLQKIETIDQPRAEAEEAGQLSMFEKKSPRRDDFRNRLIWGDNKLVMASLLKE